MARVSITKNTEGDMGLIVEECGLAVAKKLAEKMGGLSLYIPLRKLSAAGKRDYILKHFDGHNHRELARVTGYSVRWVYAILKP